MPFVLSEEVRDLIQLAKREDLRDDDVKRCDGTRAKIYDTRKTTPALRALDKYAVRRGGGFNHRIGLFDGLLVKDNHIGHVPLKDLSSFLSDIVARSRGEDAKRMIEVE